MTTPEPDPAFEPTSITARWLDAEVPVELLVIPEKPVTGWMDAVDDGQVS
jgi:hypothetical protein